jgi:hypothetical protein
MKNLVQNLAFLMFEVELLPTKLSSKMHSGSDPGSAKAKKSLLSDPVPVPQHCFPLPPTMQKKKALPVIRCHVIHEAGLPYL